MTSVPFLAAITAHTVQNSGYYTMLTQLPTFLNGISYLYRLNRAINLIQVLNLDVSGWRLDQMGLLAALPYLIMAVVVQSAGQLADLLRTRFKIPTTIVKLQIILMNQIILLIKPHLLGKKSVY